MIPQLHPLAATRATRLRRGVNLSHWFSQVPKGINYTPAHFDNYIRIADIALIRDMGFDHVRFPINCEPILAAATGGRLPADYLARLHERIREMLDHSLAVIVDVHPDDTFKHRLAESDHARAEFVDFWKQFAAAFADLDPERVVFEILNEPCINDHVRWNNLQNAAAAAIRSVAPHHTLIFSGDCWSQIPELLKLELPDDRNIIANFHLYDPIAFTHQGASWSPPWAMLTKGLTYPADPKFAAELMARITDSDARRQLNEYIESNWNADAYHRFIQPAVEWARTHGLCLTCNEFGVYKDFSPRASRLAWLHDVSTTLSANRVGWSMWDYSGGFAVALFNKTSSRIPDHGVLAALGLSARPE